MDLHSYVSNAIMLNRLTAGLGKTGRGLGVEDWWVKPEDGELGDADGNFFAKISHASIFT